MWQHQRMSPRPPKEPANAQVRFRQMLDEIREDFLREHGREHGWFAAAARMLGRGTDDKDGYIRQVHAGDKHAGIDSIEAAVRKGIRPWSYFGPTPASIEPGGGHLHPGDNEALVQFLAAGSMAPVPDGEVDLLHAWALTTRRRGTLEPADFAEQLTFLRGASDADEGGGKLH